MRIYITITEDPVFLNPFIKRIIEARNPDIAGLGIVQGTLLEAHNQNRLSYFVALFLMGSPYHLLKNALIHLAFYILKPLGNFNPLSIRFAARKYNIPVTDVQNVNSPEYIDYLREIAPDVIINQAQAILGDDFLAVAKIGTINRHGALLPKYKGRLAPFWAYLNMEQYTGVSVHLVEKEIDGGPIITQEKIPIKRFDTLESLVSKIFKAAPGQMLKALEILEEGDYKNRLTSNDEKQGSYFSSPTIKDALMYRKVMLRKMVYGK